MNNTIHPVLKTDWKSDPPEGMETIGLAGGCFWGVERFMWQIDGVHSTCVGYQGGVMSDPTYRQVCTGVTGHAETVQVVAPKDVIEKALITFFETHDPTTPNRQGNDRGTQYRSAIFCNNKWQEELATKIKDHYDQRLMDAGYNKSVTEIVTKPNTFWYAEPEHQQYLYHNPNGYCNHGQCQVSYN